MITPLQIELLTFLNGLSLGDLTQGFSTLEIRESEAVFDISKGEALVTLSLIESHLNADVRILEVGAGLCLVSLFLKLKGFNITALEPLADGFDFFEKLKSNILLKHSTVGLIVLDRGAEELSLENDGAFDLIYSNNVVEHILELSDAFTAMRSVMAESGKMVHGCPNYSVPYEPHFGLPVLSFWPNLTTYFWKTKVDERKDLWASLNFITYFRIKNIASITGCEISFQKELTFETFERLRDDGEFRARHQNTVAGRIFRLLEVTHTLFLTRYIPVWASTPMIFTMTPKHG